MFFSSNDFYKLYLQGGIGAVDDVHSFHGLAYQHKATRSQVHEYVKAMKLAILERRSRVLGGDGDQIYIGKWFRPWDVVPSLKNYRAPDGEFAVGIEVEMGFTSQASACNIAHKIQHWKHIALDYEGGNFPIEATFPPVLYSKYNGQSQPSRYLKLLALGSSGVVRHDPNSWVGTHVNVSKGGYRVPNDRNNTMYRILEILPGTDKAKYFGRSSPYNYNINQYGQYVEFKMFNSTTDWKRLRQYVDVAVALADLLYSDRQLDVGSVNEALEIGYNKRNGKISA